MRNLVNTENHEVFYIKCSLKLLILINVETVQQKVLKFFNFTKKELADSGLVTYRPTGLGFNRCSTDISSLFQ